MKRAVEENAEPLRADAESAEVLRPREGPLDSPAPRAPEQWASVSSTERRSFDHYCIFAWTWAFYSIFHFCYLLFYRQSITPHPNALSWMILLLAGGIVLRPQSVRLFSGLVVVQLLEVVSQMPMASNHVIIELFFLLAMILAGIQALIRRYTWLEFYGLFAPAGRWILLGMYFFGIFHKLNTDFLNPASSCAVALWSEYPLPSVLKESVWGQHSAIYGTFAVEGLLMVSLMFRRTRYYAVAAGCAFHLFLGVSPYAFYGAFSFLTFALYALFLPDTALEKLREMSLYGLWLKHGRQIRLVLLLYIAALCVAASQHRLQVLVALFLLLSFPLLILVVIMGKGQECAPTGRNPLTPGVIAACVAVAFMLNNAAPYVGLKTHQAMNMFSNLHLEGGRSNHLLFTRPPSLFPYLDETVRIISWHIPGAPDPPVPSLHLVYHDFLAKMDDQLMLTVTYEKDGKVYEDMTYYNLREDIEAIVQPKWIRKWMFFAGVDLQQPKACEAFK